MLGEISDLFSFLVCDNLRGSVRTCLFSKKALVEDLVSANEGRGCGGLTKTDADFLLDILQRPVDERKVSHSLEGRDRLRR